MNRPNKTECYLRDDRDYIVSINTVQINAVARPYLTSICSLAWHLKQSLKSMYMCLNVSVGRSCFTELYYKSLV